MQQLPKIIFTKEGLEKVKKEYDVLTEKRKGAISLLQTAREMGDLSENGAYKAARFEVSGIDRELRRLKYLIRFGKVSEAEHTGKMGFGNTVTLTSTLGKMTFMLVDGYESDPKEHKLSVRSPIGQAVLGKSVGDFVEVVAPAGKTVYTITNIE